jgi:RHS repeat-associated protein
LAGYEYSYDKASRITYLNMSGRLNESTRYTYDATNQVTLANVYESDPTNDEAFVFDDNGNRESAARGPSSTGESWTYEKDPHNRQSSAVAMTGPTNNRTAVYDYDYDDDDEGNRTFKEDSVSGVREEYAWDHRNRLVSVTFKNSSGTVTKLVEYQYDVNNLRIAKTVDTDGAGSGTAVETRYVYDGQNVVFAFVDGVLANRYLQSLEMDRTLVDEQIGDAAYFVMGDHLGTARDLVRDDAFYAGHRKYRVFGGIFEDTFSVEYAGAFTGAMFEIETGLQYHRARWYDPAAGRWISEDPIGFEGGDANLTRYAGNSASLSGDPSGLDPDIGYFRDRIVSNYAFIREARVTIWRNRWSFADYSTTDLGYVIVMPPYHIPPSTLGEHAILISDTFIEYIKKHNDLMESLAEGLQSEGEKFGILKIQAPLTEEKVAGAIEMASAYGKARKWLEDHKDAEYGPPPSSASVRDPNKPYSDGATRDRFVIKRPTGVAWLDTIAAMSEVPATATTLPSPPESRWDKPHVPVDNRQQRRQRAATGSKAPPDIETHMERVNSKFDAGSASVEMAARGFNEILNGWHKMTMHTYEDENCSYYWFRGPENQEVGKAYGRTWLGK